MSDDWKDDDFDDWEDDDFDDGEPDPCECLEFESDILTGQAHCWSCGRAWWMSGAEIKAEAKLNAEAAEAWAEEMAKESAPTETGQADSQ